MNEDIYSIATVAKRLNVKPYRITYLYTSMKLEEPKLRLGNRRVFTDQDAMQVATALGKTWASKKGDQRN